MLLAALLAVRFLVFRSHALGLAHGPARVIAGVIVVVAVIAVRLLAARR